MRCPRLIGPQMWSADAVADPQSIRSYLGVWCVEEMAGSRIDQAACLSDAKQDLALVWICDILELNYLIASDLLEFSLVLRWVPIVFHFCEDNSGISLGIL